MKAVFRHVLVAGAMLAVLCGPGSWADDDALAPGGVVVVDGTTLNSHFVKRGNGMLFPILELAAAAHKTAEVKDGKVVAGAASAPVIMFEGTAYVTYRDVSTLFPDLHFGATPTKAVFTTHVATTTTHTSGPSGGNTVGDQPVSIISDDLNTDQDKGNRLMFEATFQNNTSQALPPLKVILQIIDVNGATGTEPGKPKVYAEYTQSLGTLGPNAVKKVNFETTVADAESIDRGAHSFQVYVNGLEIGHQTQVDLHYNYRVEKE